MLADLGERELLLLGGQQFLWSFPTRLEALRLASCSGTDAFTRRGSVLACFGGIFVRSCVQAGLVGVLVIESGGQVTVSSVVVSGGGVRFRVQVSVTQQVRGCVVLVFP